MQIGSRTWMNQTQGKLSLNEKLGLMRQILFPSVVAYTKTFFPNSAQAKLNNQILLSNVVIPDTAIVKDALVELKLHASNSIIHHSWRCYFWGIAIAQLKHWQIDEESFLIASLMHDVGLTQHEQHLTCQCFTLESALKSESLCQKHRYDPSKTENISNAICLHMNGYLDEHDNNLSKEVILLQKATSADVIAVDLNLLDRQYIDEVTMLYPRQDFKKNIKQLMKLEAQRNPHSRTALLNALGLPSMIQFSRLK